MLWSTRRVLPIKLKERENKKSMARYLASPPDPSHARNIEYIGAERPRHTAPTKFVTLAKRVKCPRFPLQYQAYK